ncbi:hypothetical protein DL98DRAFT_624272 [Cadophora sp. DSE1049]|nr:hypothetical protein DL98DRAFT_624272 [Cadophora sp. DSE1049]
MCNTEDITNCTFPNSACLVYSVATLDFRLLPSAIPYHLQTHCPLHRIHHHHSHHIHNRNRLQMGVDMPSPSGSATPVDSQKCGSPNSMTPKSSEESSPRISQGTTSNLPIPRVVIIPAICVPLSHISWRTEEILVSRKKADGTLQVNKNVIKKDTTTSRRNTVRLGSMVLRHRSLRPGSSADRKSKRGKRPVSQLHHQLMPPTIPTLDQLQPRIYVAPTIKRQATSIAYPVSKAMPPHNSRKPAAQVQST